MPRKKSEKPPVIERIFAALWDQRTRTLTRTLVMKGDVVKAIEWANRRYGSTLSTENPANFIKDFLRPKNASAAWPDRLKRRGWGAEQLTGNGRCFVFVPYTPGQTEPFPNRYQYHPAVTRHQIQSLSMALATKALGRSDETYLIQVAVKLSVVETHFALEARPRLDILELNHLQIGIKLRRCEVDSMYAATYKDPVDGQQKRLIVTVEAKKKGQRIIEEQIVQQVKAAFDVTDVDLVVPIAMIAVAKTAAHQGGIYIAEFEAVKRGDLPLFSRLGTASEAFYEFVPPVKGI